MKSVLLPVLLIFAVLFPRSSYGVDIRFGYILSGVPVLDAKDIQLGYQFFANRFAKNYNVNARVLYDPKGDDVVERFIRNDVQYLGMQASTLMTYWEQLRPYIGEAQVSSATDELMERYVALSTLPASNEFGTLKGKRAVLQDKEANAKIYANIITLERSHLPAEAFFKMQTTPTVQRAILMLYFNQADVAFVPLRSWEMAKALNPNIAHKIRPMIISEPVFPYGVELYRSGLSDELMGIAHRSNKDLFANEDGRQLLRIIKVKKRVPVTIHELASMLEVYFYHANLLKTYKKDKP